MIDPYLTNRPQWLPVLLAPLPGNRTDKIPLDYRTGNPCNAHAPENHTSYDVATSCAAAWGPQFTVGFVITAADDVFCVDIDGALQPDGTWSPLSQSIVAALPGCMVEISQSGRGLHVWGRYPNPPPHTMKNVALHIEAYTELRFIALGTGQVGAIAERCDAFPAFLAAYFPPRAAAVAGPSDGPRADWRGPIDDDDLLRRAMQSRSTASVFGTRATFADLFLRDVDVLARAYPGDGDGGVDWSSADAALAAHLAFWTGADAERMDRLMRRSSLVREKYDRPDYLPRTIANACANQRDVLQDRPAPTSPLEISERASSPSLTPLDAPAAATPAALTMTARPGAQFLDPAAQATLFNGCFYVADQHRVLCPGGRLYKPDQFRAVFGGHTFVMDGRGERTSRNAFEALTESQVLAAPIVDGTCFMPALPFGHVVHSEGRSRVNTYWPANVRRVQGDPSPFLDHLRRVLPDPRDQQILLYFMANCVQHAGHKAQWFPLLIGVEGNGKSLFSRCVAYAVGQRYSHWPAADKLGKDFNAWLFGKLFYAIEDLSIGDATATWEKLKPMITGEALEIEGKGIDQRTDEICGNFMANSNHKNAVHATKNDRRVSHLWCAQQSREDLARDGLTEQYHADLYDWHRADGYAIVADYLHTVTIPPEFGLSWFRGRAPSTTSSALAIEAGRGGVEQEILDCVEREETGFKGGWISSKFLDLALERIGKARFVPINKRRDLLEALGYRWHPALVNGRVNNPVLPDGQKSKLFVAAARADLLAISSPAAVAQAYTAAQTS
jgi:hypothetical protein